ncbi:UNVERIFIED_CONTAM: hypothetical protein GTU68_043387 [Idotea baltica]|nr:hypothetical protein [Idotea baltica]
MTIELLTQKAIELLKSLIETPSFSSEEEQTAALIEAWFIEFDIPFQRTKNNVWATNKHFTEGKPTLLLNSHHDTVKPNSAYTNDPFKAIVKDGKLYGLGSNDAGGCLVSLLATFTHFYAQENLKYNLVIVASAEEESSGPNGLNSMLPIIPPINVAIVGEPNLVIDVRVNDAYSNQEIADILLEQSPCTKITPRSLRLNSSSINTNHDLVKAGIAMGRETYGSPTLSDQACLSCQSLKLGPGDSTRSHSANEFIYLAEIEEGIKIYVKLLNRVIV